MDRRAQLRASDADRDRIVDRLHRASTEGRIGHDELEQRVSDALKARTYGELEATVADLPGPGSRRAPARRSAAGWAVSTVRANPLLLLVAIPVLAVTTAMLLAATIVWATVVIIVMVAGGGHRGPRSPWAVARHARYAPPRRGGGRHGHGGGHRHRQGPRRDWA